MASGLFEYPPLDQEKSQFRLLQILPQGDSTLHYSLSTFDIAECPPYITLSYVWGDDEPSYSIILNGQQLLIRNNLNDALLRLARLGRSKCSAFRREEIYFWIDAICINQNDITERGHQVERMAEIYTQSAFTVAWLGHPIEESSSNTKPPWVASLGDYLSYLFKFAVYPYFQRMWIVQEILLSRSVLVACGEIVYDLDEIVLGHDFFIPPGDMYHMLSSKKMEPKHFSLYHLLYQRRSRINCLRDSVHKLQPFLPSVDSLILLCHDKQCRDPRDRVYGLRGLFPQEALKALPYSVDYNIALTDLYQQTVEFFSLNQTKLDLGQAGGPHVSITTYLASALECEEVSPEATRNFSIYT